MANPWQRYKLTIQYLGPLHSGWQKNATARLPSVQETIEKAVVGLVGEGNHGVCQVSSRTDAGVHALANTLHVDLCRRAQHVGEVLEPHPPHVVHRALNARLPHSVRVVEVRAVSSEWHARFHAKGRTYVYRLASGHRDTPSVLEGDRAWCLLEPLDVAAMQEAAVHMVGEHDFSSFRHRLCQAKSPIKRVREVQVYEAHPDLGAYHSEGAYRQLVHVRVSANSFLYNMVRLTVGALVKVGRGLITPQGFKEILEARDRVACPAAAPAHGLYLSRVDYDDDVVSETTSQGTGGAQGEGGGKELEWPNQPPSGM